MILACQNICKSFVTDVILDQASFHIEEREKAAIVGINGSGKSTLMKIIMRELEADSGEVILSKGKSIGYLAQHQDLYSQNTIYEAMMEVKKDILDLEVKIRALEKEMKSLSGDALAEKMEAYTRATHLFEQENGYAIQSEVTGVLKGLGFAEEDFGKSVDTLSGGQKTRVSLGKLLLTKPDLILLDEPTNHLDVHSIEWLETFLLNYPGAVLLVAHDRYFLDKVVTKVIEIERTKVYSFSGNYTAYAQKKAQQREAQLKAWMNQQREIKHQEEVIAKLRSYKTEMFIKRAQSREKKLENMEMVDKPLSEEKPMHIALEPHVQSGNDVLSVEGLSKSFDALQLFEDLNFEIKRGDKVAIIGNNGTGKTTILKILNNLLQADRGSIKLGTNVEIGYYDQEHQILHPEKTLFDEMSDAYPSLTNTQIRNVLAAFLFTNDDVFKRIQDLSGGERGRVSLAKLMLSDSNFLILDEPTNHLDITSKEILENAVRNYTGTVLYVSHDRYFINTTANRILELTGQTLISYLGNYDYYLEKKEELTRTFLSETHNNGDSAKDTSASKSDWLLKKEKQAKARKQANELKKTEERIHELESRDQEIDKMLELEEVFTDVAKCVELNNEKVTINNELEGLYEKWETLME